MRQLTSLDAQFLAFETPRAFGHVGGLAVYDPSTAPGGQLTGDDIRHLIAERIHMLPPFTQKLVTVPFGLDLPYWIEDPDFDLDFHVREIGLAPPGDDHQLADQVARIVSRPLDRARPLWEIYVIRGLQGGRDALLTKIHHSAVDGVSGNEILAILLDLEPEGREVPPPGKRTLGRPGMPSNLSLLGRSLLGLPRHAMRAANAAPTAIRHIDALPWVSVVPGVRLARRAGNRLAMLMPGPLGDADLLETPAARAPRTRFSGPITAHRRLAIGSLPLETIKAIKNELHVTLNDVVVALCASMMRAWLDERGELPDDPLVAMVPVSVRTEEEMGSFGNRISAMFVPIPTNEPDPRRRIERTHEVLRAAKERHEATPATLMQDATQFVPPAVMSSASRVTLAVLARSPMPALNLVISNVPGPREPLYCAGAQLMAYYPVSTIVDGVGLNITVLSYRDHIDVGIIGDRDQLEDAWTMLDGLGVALEEFHSLLSPEAAAAAPAPELVSP